jgi:hypothetical protein
MSYLSRIQAISAISSIRAKLPTDSKIGRLRPRYGARSFRSSGLPQLRAIRPRNVDPTKRVFWFCWPTYDILRSDLKKAGIERKDGLGRVVHFHSFRKTMQSLGVRYGINQRAAQEILGHSDANLTARAYTDVASLQLHREIAKLPWISPAGIVAQHGAQDSGVSGQVVSLTDILRQLQELAQATGTDGVSHALSSPGTSCQTSGNGCPGWDRTSDQVINSYILCV